MKKKPTKELPFADILTALFTREPVPIHLLFHLSDLLPENVAAFAHQWESVTEERRQVLVRHLADLSEENAETNFEAIFTLCLQDKNPEIRIAALDGLWDSSNTKLIMPIVHLLQTDPQQMVRAAAAAALTHYVLMAEWGEIPLRFSQPITQALLAVYRDETNSLPLKKAALEALGGSNHPDVPGLIEAAYESHWFELQLSAVFAMGNSADARWLSTIIAEMSNPAVEMRAEAARAAGALGKSDALEGLEQLTMDEDQDVALAAVAALGQIGGDEASRILTELAEDPEYEHLYEAIDEALEEIDLFAGQFELFTWSENGDGSDEDELLDEGDE